MGPEFLKTVAQASESRLATTASRCRQSDQTSCHASASTSRIELSCRGDSITTSWMPPASRGSSGPACRGRGTVIGKVLGTIRARQGRATSAGVRATSGGVRDSLPAQNGHQPRGSRESPRLAASARSSGLPPRWGATNTGRPDTGSWQIRGIARRLWSCWSAVIGALVWRLDWFDGAIRVEGASAPPYTPPVAANRPALFPWRFQSC